MNCSSQYDFQDTGAGGFFPQENLKLDPKALGRKEIKILLTLKKGAGGWQLEGDAITGNHAIYGHLGQFEMGSQVIAAHYYIYLE